VPFRVDGDEVLFSCLEEAGEWIAWARLPQIVVKVQARDFPLEQVELVRVSELEPYFPGEPA
jgi:hypothetical protein